MSRRTLIRLITFLGGLYFFLEFVLPSEIAGFKVDQYHDQISNGFVAIGAMAIGLGLINLLAVHGSRIIFKRSGWVDSLALLVGLFVMGWVTALDWRDSAGIADRSSQFFMLRDFALKIEADEKNKVSGVPAYYIRNRALNDSARAAMKELNEQMAMINMASIPNDHPSFVLIENNLAVLKEKGVKLEGALAALQIAPVSSTVDLSNNQTLALLLGDVAVVYRDILNQLYQFSTVKLLYQLLYDGLFVSLGSAMFSLLGFYIASAAYRAFRVRSVESGLMLGAALLVMLGQIPFGLWIWEGLPEVRLWILEVPNSAAFRAIKFGAALAGLVMAFRMWLSIESESFSGDKR